MYVQQIIFHYRVQIYISTIFQQNSSSNLAANANPNKLGAISPASTGLKNE